MLFAFLSDVGSVRNRAVQRSQPADCCPFRFSVGSNPESFLHCASAGGAPEVHEDYVVVPGAEGASPGGGGGLRRGVLAEPPQGAFPPPAARLTLRNFKVRAAQ